MKKHWSSFSPPDIYEDNNGAKTCLDIKDKDGNITGCDSWENDYGTRSIVNDETLKKKHIIHVGDSFVYGHGVPRGSTISDYIDKFVSDKYSCFNLAEAGSGHDSALLRLYQWCNKFGKQVHTVYFGISQLSRLSHWEPEAEDWTWDDHVYDEAHQDWKFSYSVNKLDEREIKNDNRRNHRKRKKTIHEGYTNLLSNVQCMAKLDNTLMAVINLSKVYNFNVYFFETCFTFNHEDIKVLKKQTENYNIKWCNQECAQPINKIKFLLYNKIKNDDELLFRELETYYIKNDGHWNTKGNKEVATVLYDETKHWYKE